MADYIPLQDDGVPPSMRTRYRDMEDLTHALVMAARLIGEYGELTQDEITGALVAISYPHHEIHRGSTFFVSYKNPDASAIADNATINLVITAHAKWPHMVFRAACGGDMEVELLEDPIVTAGSGTAMAIYNKNRGSTKAPTAGVRRDMVITNDGTRIENEFIPGGTGGNAIGGASAERPEWVEDVGTVYAFRITNRAGNAQPMSLAIEWYEESENG